MMPTTKQVQLNLTDFDQSPAVNSWKSYSIPAASIPLKLIKGFALQESSGLDLPVIYLDNVQFVPEPPPAPASAHSFFEDNLSSGWVNWSWGSNIDFSSGNAYSGSKAIAFNIYSPWAGFYIHNDTLVNSSGFASLHLAIKATQAGEKFSIALYGDNNQLLKNFTPLGNYGDLPANTWKIFDIPLADLNAANALIKGLAIQESSGQVQPVIYLDEIRLISSTAQSAPAKPLTGFIASNNKIAKNGNQVVLHGVNWFGAETTTYVPHGLWARNWKDMILQMKTLGFNSVRLPFCPATNPKDIILVTAPFTIYPIEYLYTGSSRIDTVPYWDRFSAGSIPIFADVSLVSQMETYKKTYARAFVVFSYDQGYENKIKNYLETNFHREDLKNFPAAIEARVYKLRYDISN